MTIDHPKKHHIPALRQLWQEAFGDDDVFLDGFFKAGFSPRRCRCVLLEDRLAAALYWFDGSLRGKKVAYLYAVATCKAYRGRGISHRLMDDTHRLLQTLGYSAAILVPATAPLFDFYAGMGYVPCCPMRSLELQPAAEPAPLKALSAKRYGRKAALLLPPDGVRQEGATLAFLATFAQFYESQGAVMCLSREADTLYFQQYLGPEERLPGILTALQAKKALLRLPGGENYAMYRCLDGSDLRPGYLGICLG